MIGPSLCLFSGRTPSGRTRRHLSDGNALVVGGQKTMDKGKETLSPEPFESKGKEPPVLPDPS